MLKTVIKQKAGFTPAFTMIELIFVIVIIGILSAIAIPKLAASRDDAVLVKGKSQVAAIRSGISMQKNKRLLEGASIPSFIPRTLDVNTSTTNDLFHGGNYGNILEYGLQGGTKDGEWQKNSNDAINPAPTNIRYDFHLENTSIEFTYYSSTGVFDCNKTAGATNADKCKDLTK